MEKQVLAVSREPKALSEEENRIEKRTGLRFIDRCINNAMN
jgi:hypothetical protein